MCDNTFATPYLQRPLELGVDIVVHSATKYLNGHSDVLGGAVIVRDPALAEQLKFLQNGLGSMSGAFDSFMLLRGIKTLAVRMERHCANALRVAQHLEAHPGIKAVRYPGLASHPQHELARRQMLGGFGGIITAELNAGPGSTQLATARRFLERCKLFSLGESLGGGRESHRTPGHHDAFRITAADARGTGYQRRHGASVRGHRDGRGPDR